MEPDAGQDACGMGMRMCAGASAAPGPIAKSATEGMNRNSSTFSDSKSGMKECFFLNRELSWLEFNKRVLSLAADSDRPLLERVKFLSITASNLDEFFMVRVGGLQMLSESGNNRPDPSGMTPSAQLAEIGRRVRHMIAAQYDLWNRSLMPAMAKHGIRQLKARDLSETQLRHVSRLFENEIMPVLSPIGISDPENTGPLANLALHLAVTLRRGRERRPIRAVVRMPKPIPRFISMPSDSGFSYMLLEDFVSMFIQRLFPGYSVVECGPFRVTRNADLAVREDAAGDLLSEMRAILDARKRSDTVRLEVQRGLSAATAEFLAGFLKVGRPDVYRIPGPLDLSAIAMLTKTGGDSSLRDKPWPPQPPPEFPMGHSMFSALSKRPVILCHPYESYEPIVRLIREAAEDKDVLALKIILYRTSRQSPIVASLIRAAELGKAVTAIVEIKARFDEERNMEWARELEDAGVQVIYGVKGLKTHAKMCLVVRREPEGIRRYVHFGTGNYNEITATQYSDISYLAADPDLAADASALFNAITGYAEACSFQKIEASPMRLRERILELVSMEKKRAAEGQKTRIIAKVNSLSDPQLIEALIDASRAGVKIDLNVRGICCLRPGVKGVSENIRVTSIVGRFLEHSRILYFHNGGDPKVFISSADWMPRNLDRRIETLVPVEDPDCRRKLVEMLDLYVADNVDAWLLQPHGSYVRLRPAAGRKQVRAQEMLYQQAVERCLLSTQQRPASFQPHRSPESQLR